jgi:hypothetical protein
MANLLDAATSKITLGTAVSAGKLAASWICMNWVDASEL